MILDTLANHHQYLALHPLFEAAFDFLEKITPGLPAGRHDFITPGLYAIVQDYATQPAAGARFEAHRKYIDIQFMVEGNETIYYAPVSALQAGEFQAEKDYLPLEGTGTPLALHAGEFAIFFPQDAHLPGRILDESRQVRKIVVKIPVEGAEVKRI